MLTSEQIRMARASLGWTIDVLAAKTLISSRTIKRIEASSGVPNCTKANLNLIKETFEASGIEFIGDINDGPGVRIWTI